MSSATMRNGHLTDNELMILDTIASEHGEAYLASIRRIVKKQFGKDLSYGRQADILDKFERAGWVSFEWSKPVTQPGGRSKKLYAVTGAGRAALMVNISKRGVDLQEQHSAPRWLTPAVMGG